MKLVVAYSVLLFSLCSRYSSTLAFTTLIGVKSTRRFVPSGIFIQSQSGPFYRSSFTRLAATIASPTTSDRENGEEQLTLLAVFDKIGFSTTGETDNQSLQRYTDLILNSPVGSIKKIPRFESILPLMDYWAKQQTERGATTCHALLTRVLQEYNEDHVAGEPEKEFLTKLYTVV